MMTTNNLFSVNVVITEKNNLPAVMLRTTTTERQIIKDIVKAAYHGQPLIIMPKFNDTLKSVNSLVQKGILYKDVESQEFRFTFE
jgi:hypothetical protein